MRWASNQCKTGVNLGICQNCEGGIAPLDTYVRLKILYKTCHKSPPIFPAPISERCVIDIMTGGSHSHYFITRQRTGARRRNDALNDVSRTTMTASG